MAKIKYILTDISNSENAHIFHFVDCETGKSVYGRVSGGEANVHGITCNWESKNSGWSNSFYYATREIGKREFNAMWKSTEFYGCESKDLQKYIKDSLNL